MELVCVTVDCSNPERLADFWSAALRWASPEVAPGGAVATCRPDGGGPFLEFVRVPEPKQGKNRLHVGCSAGALDEFQGEFERLVALGAQFAWREVFPPEAERHYRNWVLLDPEGNEFCLGGGHWPAGVPMPTEVVIARDVPAAP